MFQAKTAIENKNLQIDLQGALDVSGVDIFERMIAEIDLSSVTTVHIDFNQVNFIDSTGIGSILNLIRMLDEHELIYEIVNVQDDIREIFSIIGLEDLMAHGEQ
ncbi:STAS domain-containing protein [Effusibacillus consociatus]|uniref:STAS domain-containing protein n=1 Tax=Effusibacillus consociatus TaxID=1117041 RepID=A0ABV9Q1N6_9BACL